MANNAKLVKHLKAHSTGLRMKGITQSYHMLDSQAYYNAKAMKNILAADDYNSYKKTLEKR